MNIQKLINRAKEVCKGKLDVEGVKVSFTSYEEYDSITVDIFYNKNKKLKGLRVQILSNILDQYNEEFLFKKLEIELIKKEPTSLSNYNI